MIGRTAKTVLRHSRQLARPPREVCPFCFEDEHIGGSKHIPHLTIRVCQTHQACLTERRLAAGAEMKKQHHKTKSIEMAIRSLAATGRAIATAVDKHSEGLEFCAEKLNALYKASKHARPKSPTKVTRKRASNRHGRQA